MLFANDTGSTSDPRGNGINGELSINNSELQNLKPATHEKPHGFEVEQSKGTRRTVQSANLLDTFLKKVILEWVSHLVSICGLWSDMNVRYAATLQRCTQKAAKEGDPVFLGTKENVQNTKEEWLKCKLMALQLRGTIPPPPVELYNRNERFYEYRV